MTIRNLEIFTKVAELGSMSAAAKSLYITQPSVSLAISEIEKEYDIKLFDRVGNTLCLNSDRSAAHDLCREHYPPI